MADILDYLRELGDKPLAELPFNEVDSLALCQVSYLDLTDVVPAPGAGWVSVRQAWRRYRDLRGEEGIYGLTGMGTPYAPLVLQAMATQSRFADARMGAFVQVSAPERHEQFAAVTVALSDGTAYVAYRGTDSSLSGWREDLMLSYQVVPAQRDALSYLRRLAGTLSRPLRVGGHSKGGNLAAYAAAFLPAPERDRVREVWCNDSPGFDRQVVDFAQLEAIADRTRLLTPEFSIVGSLMEHVVRPEYVTSADGGIGQHGMMGWQVEEGQLVRGRGPLPEAARVDAILADLLQGRELAGREAFVDDVFGALEATGAATVDELADLGPVGVETVVAHLGTHDATTRSQVRDLLLSLGGEAVISAVVPAIGGREALGAGPAGSGPGGIESHRGEASVDELRRHQGRRQRARSRMAPVAAIRSLLQTGALRGAATLAVGLLILANAGRSAPVLGYAMVSAVGVYSAFLLVRYVGAARGGEEADPEDLAIGVLTAVPVVAVVLFRVAVSALYNLVLGVALIAWGIGLARKEQVRGARDFLAALRHARMVDGLIAIALGALVLVNPTQLTWWSQVFAGVYIAWHGVWGLITR